MVNFPINLQGACNVFKRLISNGLHDITAVLVKIHCCRTRVPTAEGLVSFGGRTRVGWRRDSSRMARGLWAFDIEGKERRRGDEIKLAGKCSLFGK